MLAMGMGVSKIKKKLQISSKDGPLWIDKWNNNCVTMLQVLPFVRDVGTCSIGEAVDKKCLNVWIKGSMYNIIALVMVQKGIEPIEDSHC